MERRDRPAMTGQTEQERPSSGSLYVALSNAIVRLLREYTGRGPSALALFLASGDRALELLLAHLRAPLYLELPRSLLELLSRRRLTAPDRGRFLAERSARRLGQLL